MTTKNKILKLDITDLNDVALPEMPVTTEICCNEESEPRPMVIVKPSGRCFKQIEANPVFAEWLSKIDPQKYMETVGDYEKRYDNDIQVSYIVSELLEITDNSEYGLCLFKEKPYYYNGKYWEQLENHVLKHLLSYSAINSGMDRYLAATDMIMKNLNRQFYETAHLDLDDSNSDVTRINAANGTVVFNEIKAVDPKDGMPHTVDVEVNFTPHHKEDNFKYILGYDYNPDADCPLFKKYLNRVLPNEKMQSILLEYLGYCLTRNMKLEKMLLCYGGGGTGKSVLFQIVKSLFGEINVSQFGIESICDNKGHSLIEMQNKLINYGSESEKGLGLNMAKFKQIVSGEEVEARALYHQPVNIRLNCKLIFNTNELPKDIEITTAYFRRLIIIPFMEKIPNNEKDIHLHTKIIDNELSGVLNMVLEGAKRLIKQGNFTRSETIEQLIKQFSQDSNSVVMFFKDKGYVKSTTHRYRRSHLHTEYVSYCKEHGQHPVNSRTFKERITALGFKVDERGTNGYAWVYCETTGLHPNSELVSKQTLFKA